MRKVKIGSKKKCIDYEYEEYCYAIIRHKRKYFIIKNNNEYSFIGDKIRDEEGRKECIERIIKDRTDINNNCCEEYFTIDEYNDLEKNKGLENFVTYYLIDVDEYINYKPNSNEELVLVSSEELKKLISKSYQREALKIMFMIK